jgi:O-antigen/teichoic acid export membrane protein
LSKSRFVEELPTGTKIARNVIFGGIRVLVVAPVPLLLTPFLIHRIGAKGLGLWAMFTAINNLTLLADFGFLSTLTKHISEYFTKKNYAQLNSTINSGIVMFAGIGAIGAFIVGGSSSLFISAFFRNASFSAFQLRVAFHWLALAVALNLLALSFSSTIAGLQRLDIANAISALNIVASAALAAWLLSATGEISGLAFALALAASLNLFLNVAAAKLLLPEFTFSLRLVRLGHILSLFSFSLRLYVIQMAVAVHSHTEKFLLAHFSGLSAAGSYDIANDLATKTRSFPSLLMSPLLPAAAELEARGENEKTKELYYRTHKYLAFLGLPIVFLIASISHRFVELWLGPGFSAAASALNILTAVNILNLACAPGALILTGKGILSPALRASVLGIVANLVLSTILVFRFGFSGAVYGTGISLTAATIYFLLLFHRETGYPIARLITQSLKPLLCACAMGLISRISLLFFVPGSIGLCVIAGCFLALYCGGLLVMGYFDIFDLEALERCVPVPKAVRRILLFA